MKDIKIFHFADLHLSETTMPQTKPALQQIVGLVQKHRPDMVVFAGDMIVKRGYITPTEDYILKSAFMDMADICKIVAIPGNHDISNRFDRLDAVTGILTRESGSGLHQPIHPNITVSSTLEIIETTLSDDKRIRIVTMPYPSKYNFLAKNENVNGNLNDVLTDTLAQALVGINMKLHAMNDETPTIMVGHGTISGGVTDSEMMMTTEIDIAISQDQLPDNIDAYMWGHLHKKQTVGSNKRVHYSGSPAPLTFAQEAFKPSITSWSINKGEAKEMPLPLKVSHQMLNINIESEAFKNGQMPMEVVKGVLAGYEVADAKVKLRYKTPKEKASLIVQKELSEHIYGMGAFDCKIVADTEDDINIRLADLDSDMSMSSLIKAWAELDPDRTKHSDELQKMADEVDMMIPAEEIYRLQGTDYEVTRLKARNYKPLIDVDLDFKNLGNITCIAGDNHNGKSQLAEAERFALWKILRSGTNLSNVVRHGADSASVSVYFTSGGREYRIDRSVKLGKSGAKGEVVFSLKNDAGEYDALNEGTASETQTSIEKIVGTYTMYHATRFGSQSEIDLLCKMTPAELKDTLQEAINVGIYDLRKEITKNKANSLMQSNRTTAERITQIDESISAERDIRQNLDTEKINRGRIDEEIGSLKQQMELAKTEYTKAQTAKEKLETNERESADVKAQIEKLEKSINRLRTIIDNTDKIDEGLAQIDKLKKQLEQAREKEIKIQQSQTKFHQQQSDLKDEVRGYESNVNSLQTEIGILERQMHDDLQKFNNEKTQLENEIESLMARAKLTETVPCSELDINATCELLTNARQAKEKAVGLKTELKRIITPDITSLQNDMNDKVKQEAHLTKLIEAVAKKMAKLEQKKQDDLATLGDSNLDEIRNNLETEESQNWSGLKDELLVAQERISAHLGDKTKQVEALHQLDADSKDLHAMSENFGELWQKVNMHESSIMNLTRKRDVSTENIGRLQQQQDDIETLKAEQKKLQKENKKIQNSIELHNMLINAFGRDGIPYLMLERALPRFEQYTNEFLCVDEGFPNATRVKISSTKEIQSGDERNEVVIKYLDDRGEHPLGEASGWQKTAIGYSLRASLAKVQAMATGTQINHCLYDEGWGACDQTNILMGKRMIQRFGQEFGKFFYITHIETLKEIADTTINVEAVEGGATIAIS